MPSRHQIRSLSQTRETLKHVGRYFKVNHFCHFSGVPMSCWAGSITSLVQPPSPQRTPLRLLKRYVNVLAACRRSCCISLETHLVLIVNKLGGFFSLCSVYRCRRTIHRTIISIFILKASFPLVHNYFHWCISIVFCCLPWLFLKGALSKEGQTELN